MGLPLFAAFPLVDSPEGRSLLTAYYDGYAANARRAGAGLMLESATWRANPDWGDRLGYHAAQIRALAGAGADIVSAYTLTSLGEAIGIVRAADQLP